MMVINEGINDHGDNDGSNDDYDDIDWEIWG